MNEEERRKTYVEPYQMSVEFARKLIEIGWFRLRRVCGEFEMVWQGLRVKKVASSTHLEDQ